MAEDFIASFFKNGISKKELQENTTKKRRRQ
jgi:hypothetical protein